MARYRTTVDSSRPVEETFHYLADFSNAEEWDPGVTEGERVGDGVVGTGSRFRLVARFLGRDVPMEYEITAFESPHRVVLEADEHTVRSVDEIRVETAEDGGTRVTYEADLRLKGPLGGVLDPLLGVIFRRIGDRADAGLRQTLGEAASLR
jgi:dehydrogenase/reductase SDR family member 12